MCWGVEGLEPRMVTITEACIQHLESIAEREGISFVGVRLKVTGGGCAGLTYHVVGFEDSATEKDLIFGEHPKIFVDHKSHKFLDGMELDVKSAMVGTHFVFNNPKATKTCGCGSSFSIQ